MVTDSYKRKRHPAYEKLKFYQNICVIRRMIYQITERFNRTHPRLVGHMRDSARSAKQNIREGYKKDSAGEFIHSIKISKGSLEELGGDLDDCFEDGLILEEEYRKLKAFLDNTDYLTNRYIDALIKLQHEGKWKARFK